MRPRPLPAQTRFATNILTFIYFGPALCFFLVYSTTTVWQFVINEYVMLYLSLRAIIVLGLNSITLICCTTVAFSALTLLVVRQQEHPACKNWVMRCWCGYQSGSRCRLFAYGPSDATASQNPIISCLIEIQSGITFLVPAYPGCRREKAVKRV